MRQNDESAAAPWGDWLEQLRASLSGFGLGQPTPAGMPDAFRALAEQLSYATHWKTTFEDWVAQAESALREAPTDTRAHAPAVALAQAMMQWLPRSVPAGGAPPPILGLAPQSQRQWRQLAEELEAWRETGRRCVSLGQGALLEALRAWQRQLLQARTPPDSETLWEAWLHALDEAHQELLRQPRFLRALAATEQHGSNIRGLAIELLEPLWHELGLATRTDLDGLALRVREQQTRDAREMEGLREELSALRAELRRSREHTDDSA